MRCKFKFSMAVFFVRVRAKRSDKRHDQHREHKCLHEADEGFVKINATTKGSDANQNNLP